MRTAFERHLSDTEGQINRLKEAFQALGLSPRPRRCEGMRSLIREGRAVVNSTANGVLLDAVMITCARKVEHYEMASYGTACTYARVLGELQVARLLQGILDEEKIADATLSDIAERHVNDRAADEWRRISDGPLPQDQAATRRRTA